MESDNRQLCYNCKRQIDYSSGSFFCSKQCKGDYWKDTKVKEYWQRKATSGIEHFKIKMDLIKRNL